MQNETSRLLIAAVPVAAARLGRILASYRPTVATTGQEARRAVERERFALAILGVYFDESRMFELMSHIRASALNRDCPLVCVLGVRGGLSALTLAMIEQTVNALEGCEFLDLSAIPDDERGNALVLRRMARHLAPPPAPIPAPSTIPSGLRP